jgi:hypothetical protein
MPGYSEYLDVENSVKVLNNLLPSDQGDTSADTWQGLKDIADKLDQNVGALVSATSGRSQNPKAVELKQITEQLARAVGRVVTGEADEGGVASTRGAITQLPGFLAGFDEERLQRS